MDDNSLCIIGSDKSQTSLNLLENAKSIFSKVLFVPIESIGLGFTDKFNISYRNTSLFNFSTVLPWLPKYYYNYAYQLFSLFPSNIYIPISPLSYLITGERFFLLTILRKKDIPTINLQLSRSENASLKLLDDAEFPIIIRVPNKKTGVIAKNHSEAKSVIGALESLKQTILLEDMVKDVVSVYVADNKVLCSVKKYTKEKDVVFGQGELKPVKISIDVENIALDTIDTLSSSLGRVDISLKKSPKVVNVTLNPDLTEVSKSMDMDLSKKIVESIFEGHKKFEEKPLLVKFFDDARSVVKDVFKSKTSI